MTSIKDEGTSVAINFARRRGMKSITLSDNKELLKHGLLNVKLIGAPFSTKHKAANNLL